MVSQVLAKYGMNENSGGTFAKEIRDIGKALKEEYNFEIMKQNAETL